MRLIVIEIKTMTSLPLHLSQSYSFCSESHNWVALFLLETGLISAPEEKLTELDMKNLTIPLPQFFLEICLLSLETHLNIINCTPKCSYNIRETTFSVVTSQGQFLNCKRMVWEVMILSLYSRKLSFMSLLLHWPHWLTACHLNLWAAGKKAGGRLGDKSKTYWGRTDDIPRTVLRGHMFRDGTLSLNPPLNGCTWYIRFPLLTERTWSYGSHLNVFGTNTQNIKCTWYYGR